MWYDTDANRILRPSRLQVYMNETANTQCEQMGLPLDSLRDEKGLAFILGSISTVILSQIHTSDEIEVSTWCKSAKGYSFVRYFEVTRNRETVARAQSVWALIDINERRMVKADESFNSFFPIDEPTDPSLLPPRARISKDTELLAVGERKILFSDIDYNMHMNNTKYPDMISDFLPDPEKYRISEISLSYVKEAHYGDVIRVMRSEPSESREVDFRTVNSAGETCLEARVKLEEI